MKPETRRAKDKASKAAAMLGRLGGKAGKGACKSRTEQLKAYWQSPAAAHRRASTPGAAPGVTDPGAPVGEYSAASPDGASEEKGDPDLRRRPAGFPIRPAAAPFPVWAFARAVRLADQTRALRGAPPPPPVRHTPAANARATNTRAACAPAFAGTNTRAAF